jgi:predicted enzyme related to lactoylglutathione lyase
LYPVTDLARAAEFYRDVLGLPQEIYSEQWQWAEFDCGNVTLGLKGGEKLPEVIEGPRMALAVEDVVAAHAELKSKGARVVGDPVDFTVCFCAEVLDPDGNTIMLHQRKDGTSGQETGVAI